MDGGKERGGMGLRVCQCHKWDFIFNIHILQLGMHLRLCKHIILKYSIGKTHAEN